MESVGTAIKGDTIGLNADSKEISLDDMKKLIIKN
jgi:hypothetical protein